MVFIAFIVWVGKCPWSFDCFMAGERPCGTPGTFFFILFNPNKECRKVTSNLIPSEESLAGYSLETCFI